MLGSASPLPRKRFAERSHRPFMAKGGSRTNGSSKRSSNSKLFNPGDAVRESGIYEVVHDNAHRSAHEVVMIHGDHFPDCDTCDARVRFKLLRTAPYIFSDEDFEEEK